MTSSTATVHVFKVTLSILLLSSLSSIEFIKCEDGQDNSIWSSNGHLVATTSTAGPSSIDDHRSPMWTSTPSSTSDYGSSSLATPSPTIISINNTLPLISDTTATTTTSAATKGDKSSNISSNQVNRSSAPSPTARSNSNRIEFLRLIDSFLLIFSNLALLPAIYLAIKGQWYAESIVYSMAMIFSALYHLCDCNGDHYCLMPYDILQFGDFFASTLTLWCTAIIITRVPLEWTSSFHLAGSLMFGTFLHYFIAGTWSFVIPAISTLLLIGSFWGYRYYRHRTLPSLIFTNQFYIATGLMTLGSVLFASQTISQFHRLYGFTHSLWHVSMSLAVALLLPRPDDPNNQRQLFENTSFWNDNLRMHHGGDHSTKPPPPIVPIGKSTNDVAKNSTIQRQLPPAPPVPTMQQQLHQQQQLQNRINSHLNTAFSLD